MTFIHLARVYWMTAWVWRIEKEAHGCIISVNASIIIKKGKKKVKQISPNLFQDGLIMQLIAGLSFLWDPIAHFGLSTPPWRAGRWGGMAAICLYFSNPTTGHCKVGTAGTSHAANPILSPKCSLLLCPDPWRGERLAQVSGWCLPTLWLLGKGKAGLGWKGLWESRFCWKSAVAGVWALGVKGSFCRCSGLTIPSLLCVPSGGTWSRGWRGTGWCDIDSFCFVMGLRLQLSASSSISSLRSGTVASLPLCPRAQHSIWHIIGGQHIYLKKWLPKRKQLRQVWTMERAQNFVREPSLPLNLATHSNTLELLNLAKPVFFFFYKIGTIMLSSWGCCGMTLGSWRVWEVFAIYQRVPRGSSQKLGIGSPVWGLGSLGGLGRLVDQPGGVPRWGLAHQHLCIAAWYLLTWTHFTN